MAVNLQKTFYSFTGKPVNLPEPIGVEEDSAGLPVVLKSPRRQKITSIEGRWRIDDEWWRAEPVSRAYYAVQTAPGQRMVLFKDILGGQWYRQSY